MCEYCENFYTGNVFNPINSMRRDMDIFGKIFIETYISKTDKGNPALTLGLCPSQGASVEQQKIIRFCPMCGKELNEAAHEDVEPDEYWSEEEIKAIYGDGYVEPTMEFLDR